MLYKLEIRPLATLEILEAYDWYELQREGLGVELKSFYNSLYNNPKTYSYYAKPVREGSLKRFPYTVIYEVFDSVIVVYSVFMAKQNPTKKRVK